MRIHILTLFFSTVSIILTLVSTHIHMENHKLKARIDESTARRRELMRELESREEIKSEIRGHARQVLFHTPRKPLRIVAGDAHFHFERWRDALADYQLAAANPHKTDFERIYLELQIRACERKLREPAVAEKAGD